MVYFILPPPPPNLKGLIRKGRPFGIWRKNQGQWGFLMPICCLQSRLPTTQHSYSHAYSHNWFKR